jgi:hypothetical protein
LRGFSVFVIRRTGITMLARMACIGYHTLMMPRLPLMLRLFATCCATVSFSCQALDYSVSIDAPPALLPLLKQHLPVETARTDPGLDRPALAAVVAGTAQAAQKLLETEGYFSAHVLVETVEGPVPGIHVQVTPGAPVQVAGVRLRLSGAIEAEPDYAAWQARLQQQWPLSVG